MAKIKDLQKALAKVDRQIDVYKIRLENSTTQYEYDGYNNLLLNCLLNKEDLCNQIERKKTRQRKNLIQSLCGIAFAVASVATCVSILVMVGALLLEAADKDAEYQNAIVVKHKEQYPMINFDEQVQTINFEEHIEE